MKPKEILVILGAQKSASTFLQHRLCAHPEIRMLPGENPAFETPEYELGGADRLLADLEKLNAPVAAFKRPNYLGLENIPDRIFKWLPNARFLVVLRNPIDRLRSAYYHYMINGFLPVLPLNEGMGALLRGELNKSWPRSDELIRFSLYGEALRRYFSIFPRSAFFICTHEEVSSDPLAVLRKICAHVNISDSFSFQSIHKRPQSINYSLSSVRFTRARNRILMRKVNNGMRVVYREPTSIFKLGARIAKFAEDNLFFLLTDNFQRPQFDAETRSELHRIFDLDILQTEDLLNRDLSMWRAR